MVFVWNQILSERKKRQEFSVSKKAKNPKLKKAKRGVGDIFLVSSFYVFLFRRIGWIHKKVSS